MVVDGGEEVDVGVTGVDAVAEERVGGERGTYLLK